MIIHSVDRIILSDRWPRRAVAKRRAVLLGGILCLGIAAATPAHAQVMLDIFSTSQLNSNPNEISNTDANGQKVGDLVGEHGLWIGYAFEPNPDLRITPSYSLAFTLWRTQSYQNIVQHNGSVTMRYDNVKLFGYREPVVAAAPAQGGGDAEKAAIVARIDALSDALDSTFYTRAAAVAPGEQSADTMVSDSLLDELDAIEEDAWGLDDEDDADSSTARTTVDETPRGGSDSLLERAVARLDEISDTLAVFVGTRALVDRTLDGLRAVRAQLAAGAGSDPAAAQATAALDAIIRDLERYVPTASDPASDALAADEYDDFSAMPDEWYAPLSLSHQSLIRNLADDYYFYTIESDAGADNLRASAGGGVVRYIATDDPSLLQYNTSTLNASVLLQQRLSRTVSVWGAYTYSDDNYPDATVFSNTQHDLTAQLRYVPSPSTMFVGDVGYGYRSYDQIAAGENLGQTDTARRITSTERSTSLFTLGLGAFFRPGAGTVFGGAFGYQVPPVLNPRLTLGFSGGQVRALSDVTSSLSDDVFSWQGTSFQALLMQMLPAEILATVHVSHESRDYGRPTITVRNTTVQLKDRIDTRTALELGLSHEFVLNSDATSLLTVTLKGGLVRNGSTNYSRPRIQLPSNDFRENYLELGLSWDPF